MTDTGRGNSSGAGGQQLGAASSPALPSLPARDAEVGTSVRRVLYCVPAPKWCVVAQEAEVSASMYYVARARAVTGAE